MPFFLSLHLGGCRLTRTWLQGVNLLRMICELCTIQGRFDMSNTQIYYHNLRRKYIPLCYIFGECIIHANKYCLFVYIYIYIYSEYVNIWTVYLPCALFFNSFASRCIGILFSQHPHSAFFGDPQKCAGCGISPGQPNHESTSTLAALLRSPPSMASGWDVRSKITLSSMLRSTLHSTLRSKISRGPPWGNGHIHGLRPSVSSISPLECTSIIVHRSQPPMDLITLGVRRPNGRLRISLQPTRPFYVYARWYQI